MQRIILGALVCALVISSSVGGAQGKSVTFDARSAHSGRWSDPNTWAGKRVPQAGDRVQIRAGNVVTYDVVSTQALRMVHVAGTLTFARDRSTRLDVGLLKVQPGDEA